MNLDGPLTVNSRSLAREGADQPASSKPSISHRTGCHERFVPFCRRFLTSHLTSEGYVGMALAGGIAALGTLVVAGLIRRAVRSHTH